MWRCPTACSYLSRYDKTTLHVLPRRLLSAARCPLSCCPTVLLLSSHSIEKEFAAILFSFLHRSLPSHPPSPPSYSTSLFLTLTALLDLVPLPPPPPPLPPFLSGPSNPPPLPLPPRRRPKFAHTLIFVVALCLVFSVAYLLAVLDRHERMWRECGATPPDDIVLKLKDCLVDTSSSRTTQNHRHRNKGRAIRDASFALTKAVFVDTHNLDAGFDFALYRYLTMAEHCLEMLEVSLTDWASVSAIAVLNVAARSALLASPIAGDGSAWYV